MYKSHKIRILLMLLFLVFAGVSIIGQPAEPPTGGTVVGGEEDVPLDSNLLVLIAGGATILYGHFYYSKKKISKNFLSE